MHRLNSGAVVLMMIAAVVTLGGCDTLSTLFQGSGSADSPTSIEPTPAQLSELERLGTGTYQEKVDLFANIETARIDNATDTNRLRYALAKSVLGHPATDLPGAYSELQSLLGANNGLTLSQTQLATIIFRNVEHMLILDSENNGLRTSVSELESSSTERNSRDSARLRGLNKRLAETQSDNQRLQAELEEIRRQLDAVLTIETSSDRNN